MTEEKKEKWADLVRLFIPRAEEVQVLGPGYYDELPEVYGVEDLPKTESELAMIDEAVTAIGSYRNAMFGDESLTFSSERVHVVTPEEFCAKVAPARFQGKTMFGHVYLWRGWKPVDFHAILIHELVHATSYLWLDLHNDGAEAMPGEPWRPVTIRRTGLALIDPSYGTWLPHFHGLNEAVTETVSLVARGLVAKKTSVHDEAGRKRLSVWMSSPPLISFADKLVQVAAGEAGDTVALWRTLTLDMVAGKDCFLAELEAKLPGTTEVLRRTGATPPELKKSAEELGLDDFVAFAAKYCRD